VLFLVNWDDTRAPREQAFELFDLIASPDKRLHAYPGEHGQHPGDAFASSADFLARHLTAHRELSRSLRRQAIGLQLLQDLDSVVVGQSG
jgi:hypothetical protein